MSRTFLLAAALCTGALSASAQSIETACLRSERGARSPDLCGCIQDAADLVLGPAEQRLAAALIREPERAERISRSPRPADRRFWQRYLDYVEAATAFCG